MQCTSFTDIHASMIAPLNSSTISSSGIHVAVRKASERIVAPPVLTQQEPSPPDDDNYSQHFNYFAKSSKISKHGGRKKDPVVIPVKHRSIVEMNSRLSLWATDSDTDLNYLEEKYRLAAHQAKLYEDSQVDELERDGSKRPSIRQTQSRDRSDQEILSSRLLRPVSADQNKVINESRRNSKSVPNTCTDMPTDPVGPPKKEKSKAKSKLMNLNKFVLGHTARKVISNWDLVENKFNTSQTHDVVIVKGENGIGNPIKIKTLPLSSLTLLLCSAQLQLKFKELNTLYTTMKYTPAEVEQSCKIAARKLVLSASSNPEVQLQCQDEIAELLSNGEPKVRVVTLQESVFSSDPEDRKKEMLELEKARAERVKNLMEEKKRKQENLKKAEARKQKSIFDFESSMGSVQYPRGVINEKRMEHMRGIIDFAYDMLLEEFYEKAVAVDPFVVDLMGAEMFPSTGDIGSPSATKEEIKAAAFEKAGFVCRKFSPESRKIDLLGPPCLIELLRRAVALGKGLYGTSFNDVVELLQAYSATRISAFYRGFTRRWRYRVARRAWKHLYNFMKSKIFKAWANEMRMMKNLRKYCFRKLTAWKYYTKSNFKRRYKFRVCYWPFFVWR